MDAVASADIHPEKLRGVRPRVLSLCIASAWALGMAIEGSTYDRLPASKGHAAWVAVSNCDDSGSGSLRAAVAIAGSGDTIDLTQLDCSVITLTSGAIAVAVNNLAIHGPGAGALEITAANNSQIILHQGSGTFSASGITFSDGYAYSTQVALGGCIFSQSNVELIDVVVSDCHAKAVSDTTPFALGGGVFAQRSLTMSGSVVRDNVAEISNPGGKSVEGGGVLLARSPAGPGVYIVGYAKGGGINAGTGTTISASTITGNVAISPPSPEYSFGGGVFINPQTDRMRTTIDASTISNNSANGGGGIGMVSVYGFVTNSTISGNVGDGIGAPTSTLFIYNSTVAFNQGSVVAPGAGVYALYARLYLQSTILANNGRGGIPTDLTGLVSGTTLTGANNLIIAADGPLPPDTLRVDPLLAPLANNGGPTLTHALLAGSPAIDTGNNAAGFDFDQRGPGYVRVSGIAADIGAFEAQPPDIIFTDGFELPTRQSP